MISIEQQLTALPHMLHSLETKITELNLSKPELEKMQTSLDSLDDRITSRKYPISNEHLTNMLEMQALLDYARGDVKKAKMVLREAVATSAATKLVTHIAKDLHEDIELSKDQNDTAEISSNNDDHQSIPHYFTVSTLRLVLLSIITGSLYVVYWSYKNWKAIEKIERRNSKGKVVKVYPKLSAVFFPLTAYEMFCVLRESARDLDMKRKIDAGAYGWGVFLLNIISLSFLLVIGAQNHMNKVKVKAFGNTGIRKGTSIGEVSFILIAIALTILTLAGYASNSVSDASSVMSQEAQSKKATVDALTVQYDKCSAALVTREKNLDLYDQYAVAIYNNDWDECEAVRIQQNNAVDEYNALIRYE